MTMEDLSSVEHAADSGVDTENDDGDEQIPVAVPVAAVEGSHFEEESDDELDDEAVGGDAGFDTTIDSRGVDTTFDSQGVDTTFDNAVRGDDDVQSLATDKTPPPPSAKKRSISNVDSSAVVESSKKSTKYEDGKSRQPIAKGLTIPYRTVKRIMKNHPDIGIIQNDAAIIATVACELFIKELATKSLEIANCKGRITIKYDDVAEARASNRKLSFLDMLLP
ncbi:hypothetical protein ACHAWF_000917 [Thalassiosira exigua]